MLMKTQQQPPILNLRINTCVLTLIIVPKLNVSAPICTIPLMGKLRTKKLCELQSPSKTFRSQAIGHSTRSGSPLQAVMPNPPVLQIRSGPQSAARGTDSKNAHISNVCVLQFSDCKINTGLFEKNLGLLAYAYILQ